VIADYAQSLLEQLLRYLPRLISALMIFAASLLAASALARWIRHSTQRLIERPEVPLLISRTARWTVITLGTLAALDQINFDVTTFVASLGVAGLTIGFALQDITRNYVAGVLLLVRRPFKVGDAISVADKSGKVLDIGSRDITILTWDGEQVIVPNLKVYDQLIVNYSATALRRRTIRIGLGYGQDLTAAMEQILGAARSVEGVLSEPAPMIHAEEMGDYAVSVALRFWLDTSMHSLFDVHSNMVKAVDEVVTRSGIDMPFPIQTVLRPEL